MDGRRLAAAAGAACVAGLVASSCSAVPTAVLNRSSVQVTIARWLADRYHLTAPRVTCPSDVAGRAGTRFHCATTIAGTHVTVTGLVADTSGHFDVSLNRAVIDPVRTSQLLAEELRAPGRPAPVVTCGRGRVRVIAPGGTLTCTATEDGVTTVVVGTPSTTGDIRFTVGVPGRGTPPVTVATTTTTTTTTNTTPAPSTPPTTAGGAPTTTTVAPTPPTTADPTTTTTVVAPTPATTTPPTTAQPPVPPTTTPPATDPGGATGSAGQGAAAQGDADVPAATTLTGPSGDLAAGGAASG